ncbi:MAG TPA: class I SAM-dependent methyltransferase [Patescibacteria group bacterium]|nr:class I SAM-dependent methyltransferase [Patescibacteria group bacterium]
MEPFGPESLFMEERKMMSLYGDMYRQGLSSRFVRQGMIGITYRLEKNKKYFIKCYAHEHQLRVLELGSSLGEMRQLIMESIGKDVIREWICSEHSPEAVAFLRERGIAAEQIDAQQIPFPDNSFDIVCCFDVMHHVADPKKMAQEMLRVSKKHFFLCESNGLSLVRKIGEMPASARAIGERSYTPGTYRSFFTSPELDWIRIHPFAFLSVPKIPKPLVPLNAFISEIGERIPLLRWQGQSLLLYGQKKVTAE